MSSGKLLHGNYSSAFLRPRKMEYSDLDGVL